MDVGSIGGIEAPAAELGSGPPSRVEWGGVSESASASSGLN